MDQRGQYRHARLSSSTCKGGLDAIHRLSQEDMMLEELVNKHGTRNWTVIAAGIHGRSGKSCRLRWVISARTRSKGPWLHSACLAGAFNVKLSNNANG